VVPAPMTTTPGGEVFFQHDFAGQRIFQHRIVKWRLDGPNFRHPGVRLEAESLAFLAELRAAWDGRVRRDDDRDADEQAAFARLSAGRHFLYERVGHDSRPLELRPDGRVGQGAARLERTWDVERGEGGAPELVLRGDAGVICRLAERRPGEWHGRWTQFERMPIVLRPRPAAIERPAAPPADDTAARLARTRYFDYLRVGHDQRVIELRPDRTIGVGRARLERTWDIDHSGEAPALLIRGESGLTCRLTARADGAWQGRWTQFEQMPILLVPRAT
jgi:hypothetical protein